MVPVLEITPVGCEARPPSFMASCTRGRWACCPTCLEIDPRRGSCRSLCRTRPICARPVQRCATMSRRTARQHADPALARGDGRTSVRDSAPGGVFDDSVVTHWRGRRQTAPHALGDLPALPARGTTCATRWSSCATRSDACGPRWMPPVSSRIADGEHVYDWLLQWFNPARDLRRRQHAPADIAPYPATGTCPSGATSPSC